MFIRQLRLSHRFFPSFFLSPLMGYIENFRTGATRWPGPPVFMVLLCSLEWWWNVAYSQNWPTGKPSRRRRHHHSVHSVYWTPFKWIVFPTINVWNIRARRATTKNLLLYFSFFSTFLFWFLKRQKYTVQIRETEIISRGSNRWSFHRSERLAPTPSHTHLRWYNVY